MILVPVFIALFALWLWYLQHKSEDKKIKHQLQEQTNKQKEIKFKCYYCKKSNTTNMFELFGDSKPENKTQTLVVNCRHCGKLVQIDVEH